jgi:DNA topoisomerase-1
LFSIPRKKWQNALHRRPRQKKIAKIVRQCQELPGHALFEYLDEDGKPHGIHSGQVNEYLHEIAGAEFTAKDFRTWAGTLAADQALSKAEAITQAKIAVAVKDVAQQLGNTPTVCRNCYMHPVVLSMAEKNTL